MPREAATMVAVGTMIDGEFRPAAVGYWRCVAHDDGMMIAVTPHAGGGEPDVVDGDNALTVREVGERARCSPSTILAALFGGREVE